jgi:hypothetical protein
LRFAVHLQFCSPPASKKKGKAASEPRYYLYSTVRVVFSSQGLDAAEKLRVVAEGPAALAEYSTGRRSESVERFNAYSGPDQEWSIARKKAKEREKVRDSRAPTPNAQRPPLEGFPLVSAHLANPPPSSPSALPPFPSSLASPSPLPFPSSSAISPLVFDRVPSPRLPHFLDARERKVSQSNLTASRPASRNEGSRERCGR